MKSKDFANASYKYNKNTLIFALRLFGRFAMSKNYLVDELFFFSQTQNSFPISKYWEKSSLLYLFEILFCNPVWIHNHYIIQVFAEWLTLSEKKIIKAHISPKEGKVSF